MAIRITPDTQVIDDNRHLLNIANTDVTTQSTINHAIIRQENILKIYDSSGSVTQSFYFASAPGVKAIV